MRRRHDCDNNYPPAPAPFYAEHKMPGPTINSFLKRLRRKGGGGGWTEKAISLPTPVTPAPDRHRIAIAAIVKDEVLDLEEWVRFHLMMGVRSIYIYDNGSTDGTRELAAELGRDLPVAVIPWVGFLAEPNPQRLAYAHALMNFGRAYRWMMFIDVDEFAFPVKANTLTDALAELDDLPSISLPWHMFGTSGHVDRPVGLVIENYTERAPFPPPPQQRKLLSYKSVVDPCRVTESSSHAFALQGMGQVSFNDRRQQFSFAQRSDLAFASAEHIQLNHYFTKSEADFQAKLQRGRVTRSGAVMPRTAEQRKAMIDESAVEDRAITRFAGELRDEMGKKERGRHAVNR